MTPRAPKSAPAKSSATKPSPAKPPKSAGASKPSKSAPSSRAASGRRPRETEAELKARARRIGDVLRALHAHKGTALRYDGPFQLLVSTVLSAQCTDDTVNRVTPGLFARFPDPAAMAGGDPAEIEKLIFQTGFYRQKTKSIVELSKDLVEKFGGRVPESMEELTALRGVGRKTANLVRAMHFGHPGLVVDTHFKRLVNRMGLVETDDPTKIEHRIAELLPPEHWTDFGNALIWHGRSTCPARKPRCAECPVRADCRTGMAEG